MHQVDVAAEFRAAGAPAALSKKLITNVLEHSLANAQTCRVVAYFLLSLGDAACVDDAVALLEMVCHGPLSDLSVRNAHQGLRPNIF
jgi:hypothetical protein